MDENNAMELMEAMERLESVAEALEKTAARLVERQLALAAEADEHVGRIVATVDQPSEQVRLDDGSGDTSRHAELERRLMEAEAKIAELTASAAVPQQSGGRKTLSAGMASMLAKQGVTLELGASGAAMDVASLDGALSSLGIEQRIAVKSELRRAGLLG